MSVAQQPPAGITYAIESSGDPMAIAQAARKTLAGLDPALPLNLMESYAQLTREKLTGMFFVSGLIGVDGLVALLLSAVGIFGVMANLVGERTREIGVRLAMGARREDVLKMILKRAGWLTGTGVCVGLVLAFALAHGLANLIRDVSPNDPAVFSGITGTVIAVALIASWLPARRASRIDPMVALRDE
jgi:putative ABC transport system permease protein